MARSTSAIVAVMGSLTLPALVFLGQAADGLAYQLAHGHGTELNVGMAVLIAAFGPPAVLGVKLAAGLYLAVCAHVLQRHRTVVVWLAVAGFLGAGSELLALV
jgi:hypothetical protein